MITKNNALRKPLVQKTPSLGCQDRSSRLNHTNPVTVEDFDRERLGVAAKE